MSLKKKKRPNLGLQLLLIFKLLMPPHFQTPIIHIQLRVLNKSYIIDMVALFDEFKSAKNKEKRKSYHATFDQKEKDRAKRKWKEKMHELKKHILFFLFH